jgi:hypothetical protein
MTVGFRAYNSAAARIAGGVKIADAIADAVEAQAK